jgi:K+/H+ antiporter YhaU regulatory subunit KhtT
MDVHDIIFELSQSIARINHDLLSKKKYYEQQLFQINLEIEKVKEEAFKLEKHKIFFETNKTDNQNG